MNFRKMLISNVRKAMLDSITALDKKTLQQELKSHLKLEFEYKDEIERLNNIINELDAMFDGDLDGFFTINEKGSCNEIIEVIQNYKNKLKELKEGNHSE